MPGKRALVVYYSRSGHTRQIARELAAELGADEEEIGEPLDREGPLGYLRCALEALWGASAEIRRPRRDPGRYDLVAIGSPVWYAAVSTPVRTYLWVERDRLPRVAFFLTHGGMGSERALGQMAALAGKRPAKNLVVRVREIEGGEHREKLASFAKALLSTGRRRSPRAGSRPEPPPRDGARG